MAEGNGSNVLLATQQKKEVKEGTRDSPVSLRDLALFARQFATMIDAGLPLINCLEILGNTMENKRFGRVVLNVKETVEGDSNLSDALRQHPRVFDDLFVNLVAAGEAGGILDTILNRQAAYLEKSAKLRRQIKGALTHLIIIVCIAVGAIMTILSAKNEMPGLTQFASSVSLGFIISVPLVLGGVIFLYMVFYRLALGREIIHRILLFMPILGPLVKKVAMARFTRTLGTLLSSGVPILDALEITARTVGNVVVEKSIRYARDRISEGKNMAEPLSQAKVFPGMVVQMIAVGEQTGALDQMCSKIADFYEVDVAVAVANVVSLSHMLLVFIVGFIGGVVGGMLVG